MRNRLTVFSFKGSETVKSENPDKHTILRALGWEKKIPPFTKTLLELPAALPVR
jgi:hypothetical protein